MFLFNSEAWKWLIVDEIAADGKTAVKTDTGKAVVNIWGSATQLMTCLSFHKRHCALMHKHTHTHTRWGYKPPTVFNYVVKFYPNALVMLWRRKAAQSLGTDGTPYSEWRRKEDIPGGAGGRPRHHSHGGSIQYLVFLFLLSVAPLTKATENGDGLYRFLFFFSPMQIFLGTWYWN